MPDGEFVKLATIIWMKWKLQIYRIVASRRSYGWWNEREDEERILLKSQESVRNKVKKARTLSKPLKLPYQLSDILNHPWNDPKYNSSRRTGKQESC